MEGGGGHEWCGTVYKMINHENTYEVVAATATTNDKESNDRGSQYMERCGGICIMATSHLLWRPANPSEKRWVRRVRHNESK